MRSLIGSLHVVIVVALALFLNACGGGQPEQPQQTDQTQQEQQQQPATAGEGTQPAEGGEVSPEVVQQARQVFDTRCVTCHGTTGHGDGPGAAALQPKPASFAEPEWQQSLTDEHIEKIIIGGGAAVGKSLAMPPNPDLGDKPEVVRALREIVRGFGRQ